MNRGYCAQTAFGFVITLVVLLMTFVLIRDYSFLHRKGCYNISASFADVSGVTIGSYVKVSGVSVGHVAGINLDRDLSGVDVTMCIHDDIKIPQDSIVAVSSNNVVSENKYVRLEIGAADDMLSDGGVLMNTQSSLNLEYILREFMKSR